jgi:hypothetical protein
MVFHLRCVSYLNSLYLFGGCTHHFIIIDTFNTTINAELLFRIILVGNVRLAVGWRTHRRLRIMPRDGVLTAVARSQPAVTHMRRRVYGARQSHPTLHDFPVEGEQAGGQGLARKQRA